MHTALEALAPPIAVAAPPVARPALRTGFAWSLAGNAAYAGAQWAAVVVLARMGSPEIVGQYALGLAVASPLFLLCGLHTRAVQATDAAGRFAFEDYWGLRLVTTAAALALTCGAAVVLAGSVAAGLMIAAVSAVKAGEAVGDTFYGRWQHREDMGKVGRSLIAKAALSVAVLAAVLGSTARPAMAVLAMAASHAAVLAFYDSGGKVPRAAWGLRALAPLAALAAPLGLTMMLVSLQTALPRYQLAGCATDREVGFFAALSYLPLAPAMVVAALGQAASPRLANSFHLSRRADFAALFRLLAAAAVGIGLLMIVAAALFGETLLGWVYGAAYAARRELLLWLACAALAGNLAAVTGFVLTAMQRFRVQALLIAGACLVTALAGWGLIPRAGSTGAAQAQLAGYAVQAAGGALAVRTAWRALGARKETKP